MNANDHSPHPIHPTAVGPVPQISDNIVEFINQVIINYNFSHFVEYGMGNSTRYFLKKLVENKKSLSLHSIEFDPKWYFNTISLIQKDFINETVVSHRAERSFWPYAKCKNYINAKSKSDLSIPLHLQRLDKGKRKLAGKFGHRFLLYRLFRTTRPFDATHSFLIADTVKLNLILCRDFIKDQYGESPHKYEYIEAPSKFWLDEINRGQKIIVLFLIDGGPRQDILKRILDLEEQYHHFSPIVFLCDANREFYKYQIQRRPAGVFIPGSNLTLDKRILYKNEDRSKKSELTYGKEAVTDGELAEKELWYYNSIKSMP